MASARLLFVVISLVLDIESFLQHSLWKENVSLVASIRVASLTVFSPARCLGECVDKDCTLLTLAVTRSTSGERLDCHLTKVTDWLTNADVYLKPCNQSTHILCSTFVGTRTPHLYFPLDGANQLDNLGSLLLPDRKPTLLYKLGSQSGNPFTCTGSSGNPHVKYLLNILDPNNGLVIDLNDQWQPTQGLTLAIWVMFPGSPTYGPIFDFYSNRQLTNYDKQFWFWYAPGQMYFTNNDTCTLYGPVMGMTPGQWYHVAMTWSPEGDLLFYWNASQVFKAANVSAWLAGFKPSYLLIGARIATQQFMRACFAHAVVHTEVMSQLQLQHLMMTQSVM